MRKFALLIYLESLPENRGLLMANTTNLMQIEYGLRTYVRSCVDMDAKTHRFIYATRASAYLVRVSNF